MTGKLSKWSATLFYERAKKAYAVVITGETAKYGNIILKKALPLFPDHWPPDKPSMQYDFDEVIERRGTGALKYEALLPRWGRDDLIPPVGGGHGLQDAPLHHGSYPPPLRARNPGIYRQAPRFL